MAFEDLTGASGFTSNEDGATANLNINMSDDDARTLWDVQAAVQQIATDFQTAVRAAADFQSYLISIRETSNTVRLPSLGMEGGPEGNMPYAGGRVDASSSSTQSGEASMSARVGQMLENMEGISTGAMGAAAEGGRVAGPLAGGGGGLLGNLTNLLFLGQAFGGGRHPAAGGGGGGAGGGGARGGAALAPGAAGRAMSGVGSAASALRTGGMLSAGAGLVSRLGPWGMAAGATILAGNEVAETWARSRAMAIAAGNGQGTGWGFEQMIGQAGMAITPFISAGEAAEIYATGIEQGWANNRPGASFGEATDFAYRNVRDYNLSIADSYQLLDLNVGRAGQSINELNLQLASLAQVAQDSGQSLQAVQQGTMAISSNFITRGADPSRSITAGIAAATAWSSNPALVGFGDEALNMLAGSQQATMLVAVSQGIPWWSVGGANSDPVQTAEAYYGLIDRFIGPVYADLKAGRITQQDAEGMLSVYLQQALGVTFDRDRIKGFLHEYDMRGSVVPDYSSQVRATEESYQGTWAVNENAQANTFNSTVMQGVHAVGYGFYGGIHSLTGWDWAERQRDYDYEHMANIEQQDTYTHYSPQIEEVISALGGSAGLDAIQLYNRAGVLEYGTAGTTDDIRDWIQNEEVRNRLSSGDLLIDTGNGQRYTFSNIGAAVHGNSATANLGNINVDIHVYDDRISTDVTVPGTGTPENNGR